jgi:hypothetical protein
MYFIHIMTSSRAITCLEMNKKNDTQKICSKQWNDSSTQTEHWRSSEKQLVRKLDMTLLPLLWLLYLFNYLDRNNIV